MATHLTFPVENFLYPSLLDPASNAPSGATAERVLLIEDDPSFREAIGEFLTESGFTVVTAENGVEGVRELMRGEFTAILCDMLMPKLPGDMFYRAVEGIQPALCARFIFMTGHRGDENTNAFIGLVKGTVLMKPFSMKELLETIERTRRSRREPLGGPSPAEPQELKSPVLSKDDPVPEAVSPGRALPGAAAVVPAPESFIAGPGSPAERSGLEPRAKLRLLVAAALVLGLAGGTALWFRVQDLRTRTRAAEATLQGRQREWASLSENLQGTAQARLRIEALIARPARVAAARDVPGWTPWLRRAVMNAGSAIAFRVIQARGVEGHPGACELHLEGSATGREPRALAENFRRSIETALAGQSRAATVVLFKRLEAEPPADAAAPEFQRVRFTISATLAKPEPLPHGTNHG